MNKSRIKDKIRERMRIKYGFSPHWKDITIINLLEDEQKYFHALISVEELVDKQRLFEIRAPKRYYKLEYDGFNIEQTDEEGRVYCEIS